MCEKMHTFPSLQLGLQDKETLTLLLFIICRAHLARRYMLRVHMPPAIKTKIKENYEQLESMMGMESLHHLA